MSYTPFKMKGHTLPGIKQKSPAKHAGDDNYEHHETIKHTGSKKKWYLVRDWFWNKEDEHKRFERGTNEYRERQLTHNPGPNYITEDDGTRTWVDPKSKNKTEPVKETDTKKTKKTEKKSDVNN